MRDFVIVELQKTSEEDELHRLWRDHVGIRPRYAGRGASASRSLTSDNNNTLPSECVARGPDVRNVSYPNRGLGDFTYTRPWKQDAVIDMCARKSAQPAGAVSQFL
ncbi:hypothetical protein Bbelb_188180 [Branchiostoma belcheri]|nr:hypothetical protein Bbelb_188180 [Branchiostoma belcheri]